MILQDKRENRHVISKELWSNMSLLLFTKVNENIAMLYVVSCMLSVVCCMLCCMLYTVRCMLLGKLLEMPEFFEILFKILRCMLYAACCLLYVACCAVCCMLYTACYFESSRRCQISLKIYQKSLQYGIQNWSKMGSRRVLGPSRCPRERPCWLGIDFSSI